jgi:hypothetical protein
MDNLNTINGLREDLELNAERFRLRNLLLAFLLVTGIIGNGCLNSKQQGRIGQIDGKDVSSLVDGGFDAFTPDTGIDVPPSCVGVIRADIAVWIYDLLDWGKKCSDDPDAPTSDVPADHPAAKEIACAIEQGVMNAYVDGFFRPDDSMNKAEMSKVVAAASNLPVFPDDFEFPEEHTFVDVGSDDWYYQPVMTLVYWSVLKVADFPERKFSPGFNATDCLLEAIEKNLKNPKSIDTS